MYLTNSGANNIAINDVNALSLSDVRMDNAAGSLTVNANGAITQAFAPLTSIITGTGAVTIASGAGAITLNGTGNNFRGATSLTNTGANNIVIRDVGALALSGVSMTTTTAGGLTVNTGGAITQTGAIVTGMGASAFNAGANAITLDNIGNNFVGPTSLTNTGANNISIRDAGALILANVRTGGGLNVQTNSGLTQQANTSIVTGTGAAVTIDGGAGAITLDNAGNNFAGPTSLTNTGANDITIRDVGALILRDVSMSPSATGTLTITTNGDLTQLAGTAITTGTGDVTFDANTGAIMLDNTGNDFRGAVSLINEGADIVIRDSGDLLLDSVAMLPVLDMGGLYLRLFRSGAPGSLRVTTNGAITQTTGGRINVGSWGDVVFNAGAGEINLGNASNHFASLEAVSLSNTGANNITIRASSALTLGAVTTSGNLSVQTNGALEQAQSTTILTGAGGSNFNAGAGAITLNNTGNDFSGSVSLTNTGANNIAIRDINALNLAGVSMTGGSSGSLTVNTGTGASNTGGDITQTGAIVTGTGASSFIAGGSGSSIMLTNASNDFRGSVGLISWSDASITDGTSLKLGASNVSGNLNVMMGTNGVRGTGNLTQNAAVMVQGVTNITAGASNTTINLTNHGNQFVGGVNPTPLNNIANYNVYPAP